MSLNVEEDVVWLEDALDKANIINKKITAN